MRILLADENFPLPSVKALRANGHDVYSVAELEMQVFPTNWLLKKLFPINAYCSHSIKTLVSLCLRMATDRPPNGIIFFRWEHYQPEEPGKFLITIFEKENLSFDFKITVIDEDSIRQRNY